MWLLAWWELDGSAKCEKFFKRWYRTTGARPFFSANQNQLNFQRKLIFIESGSLSLVVHDAQGLVPVKSGG